MISAGDASFSGTDGQSPSEDQTGGDMSPFTVPVAAATKDPIRLKCREMLSAALKTPREFPAVITVHKLPFLFLSGSKSHQLGL